MIRFLVPTFFMLVSGVAVADPPVITTQPSCAVVSVGQAASLSVANSGTVPFSYQWLKDGVFLPGQTNSTLSLTSFQFVNSGSYYVAITNASGIVISFPASLSVSNAPLQTWGQNGYGQLGDGTTNNRSVSVVAASNVVSVAGGERHSLFIKTDKTLWAMGRNNYGQLGNGTVNDTNRPIVVTNSVVAAAAGNSHSLFVKADGTLWGMGRNTSGQLGNGTVVSTNNRPVVVASNVVAVAAGNSHSLFVKADGTLWVMGENSFGQLGNGTLVDTNRPIVVASNVVAAAAGYAHSLFVKADGTLWAMGRNNSGQLGNRTLVDTNRPIVVASNVVAAAAGCFHSLFVKADGALWAMGYNSHGELGDGSQVNTNRPIQVASNVTAVAGGYYHSLFAKADGALWAMGFNTSGQLGNGTLAPAPVPVLVNGYGVMMAASLPKQSAAYHSLAVASAAPSLTLTNRIVNSGQPASLVATVYGGDGTFTYQWQKNGTNIVAATNTTYSIASTVPDDAGTYSLVVTGPFVTTSVSATLTVHTPFAITAHPVSAVVGLGQSASLSVCSTGNAPLCYQWLKDGVILPGQTNSTLVYASFQFTNSGSYYVVITNADGFGISFPAFLSVNNAPLQSWGDNSFGQLGNSTLADTNRPMAVASNVVAMSAGNSHSLFVKADGMLWAMGRNEYGQFGNSTTNNSSVPIVVVSNVVAATAGSFHSLLLRANGTLWAVGRNEYGQLGNGTTNNSSVPIVVASNVVATAAGYANSFFMKADGTLWGMGLNNNGQLGNGTLVNTNRPIVLASNVMAVAAGQYHSLFVKADGTLWSMGLNNRGQLGNGTLVNTNRPIVVASNVVAVAGGNAHSLFVKANGTLWAMGHNDQGQLGGGTLTDTNRPVQVNGGVLQVASLAAHPLAYHSMAVACAVPTGACMLAIHSSHGTANPAAGVYGYNSGSVLTNTVTGLDQQGNTQYVCTGWSMPGNTPTTGTGLCCVMTLSNTATLTWLWMTNYWLDTDAGSNGSVSVGDGWQALGVTTSITATATQYYYFTNWTGSVTGFGNPLNLLMDEPKVVTANFAPNMVTDAPVPVPEAWLALHGWTNSFSVAVTNDADHDGQLNWAEYVAGTVPTNSASVLAISGMGVTSGTNFTLAWPSVAGRMYGLDFTTNLMQTFGSLTGAISLAATPPVNAYTNTSGTLVPQSFYRVRVWLP